MQAVILPPARAARSRAAYGGGGDGPVLVSERRKPRRVVRPRTVVQVLEGSRDAGAAGEPLDEEAKAAARAAELERKLGGGKKRPGGVDAEELQRRRAYQRIGGVAGVRGGEDSDDEVEQLKKLPDDFSLDYLGGPLNAKPLSSTLVRAAAERLPEGETSTQRVATEDVDVKAWLRHLRLGFSVLVQGVGSKRQLLDRFAFEVLMPWGAAVVRLLAFDQRASLADCLRETLDSLHPEAPRAGNSADALAASLHAARLAPTKEPLRPLAFVIHNLECLPPAHQAALARLAAVRGVHLVASVDSIWANLAWSPHVVKSFNFIREEAHTFESFEAENFARFPNGLPAWCDPFAAKQKSKRTSLALVLKSLTKNHRELVQAIAEHQLEAGGRTGISMSRLLTEATDLMIVNTATKLKALLNELKDHEVVAQRGGADGGTLLYLTCDNKVLQKLAKGQDPVESEDEESQGELD